MKSFILFFIISLILVSCKTDTKVYPNTNIDQIGTTLSWGMNYTQVKKILTEDFKLDFSKEIKQHKNNKTGKAYEYLGGKFNGIYVDSWVSFFENDSLISLFIIISNDDPTKIQNFLKDLKGELKRDTLQPGTDTWLIEKNNKVISVIEFLSSQENNNITIAYLKPVFHIQ